MQALKTTENPVAASRKATSRYSRGSSAKRSGERAVHREADNASVELYYALNVLPRAVFTGGIFA